MLDALMLFGFALMMAGAIAGIEHFWQRILDRRYWRRIAKRLEDAAQ